MDVTELGIVMLFIVKPLNELEYNSVTVFGITVLIDAFIS